MKFAIAKNDEDNVSTTHAISICVPEKTISAQY